MTPIWLVVAAAFIGLLGGLLAMMVFLAHTTEREHYRRQQYNNGKD